MAPRRSPFGDVGPETEADRRRERRERRAEEREAREGWLSMSPRERAEFAPSRPALSRSRTGTRHSFRGRQSLDERARRATGGTTRAARAALGTAPRFLRNLGHGRTRRALLAEMVAVAVVVAVSQISRTRSAPRLATFVAPFGVFLILAFVADFGDDWARVAVAFGGLTLLTVGMANIDGITGIAGALGTPAEPAAPSPAAPPAPSAGGHRRVRGAGQTTYARD